MLSTHESNKHRYAYYDFVNSFDRKTYHLTVDYHDRKCFEKPIHQNKDYDMSAIFSTFYLCRLLPYIMNTTKFTKDSIKHLQPKTIVFPDRYKTRQTLHHHAVICPHESTAARLDAILETELKDMFPFKLIESIRLTEQYDYSATITHYANKDYQKFHDDVLVFKPS